MAPNDRQGYVRIASVGQTTEEQQPCRWIEVQFDADDDHRRAQRSRRIEVFKVLIPEKFLAKGQSPLEHVVRAWIRHGEDEPKKLEKPDEFSASPLPLILSGPWKDAKELEKAEVECKLGKLACKGVEGTLEFDLGKGGVMKCKFEDRLHADSPFGVVTSHWTLQPPEAGPMKSARWTGTSSSPTSARTPRAKFPTRSKGSRRRTEFIPFVRS